MRSPWSVKKSAPKIGRRAVAIQNLCLKVWPRWEPKETSRKRLPKVSMEDPFAATRSVVRFPRLSDVEAGKTHSLAPESTRKDRPVRLSWMEMVPLDRAAAAINGRPWRFPRKAAAKRPGLSSGNCWTCTAVRLFAVKLVYVTQV